MRWSVSLRWGLASSPRSVKAIPSDEPTNDPQDRPVQPFGPLDGVGRALPAGSYEVITDEELIEGLSFPVYRRVATMMLAPGQSSQAASMEMLSIDPLDLAAALERDKLAVEAGEAQ